MLRKNCYPHGCYTTKLDILQVFHMTISSQSEIEVVLNADRFMF